LGRQDPPVQASGGSAACPGLHADRISDRDVPTHAHCDVLCYLYAKPNTDCYVGTHLYGHAYSYTHAHGYLDDDCDSDPHTDSDTYTDAYTYSNAVAPDT
jgi:hypothetical protein